MAQIFENWIWDYEILESFARHYKTNEPLPKALFDKMFEAKNVTSGLDAQFSLRNCVYDMMSYDAYDPGSPVPTDDIWIMRKFQITPTNNASVGTISCCIIHC